MAHGNGLLDWLPHGRRLAAPLACVLVLSLLPAALPAPAHAANGRCDYQSSQLDRVGAAKLRQATLCLLNRERERRGRTKLTMDPRLQRAANRHAKDMVRKRYFTHGAFTDRIADVGYPFGTKYLVGENLAWGTGRLASPQRVVRAWMRSRGHRRNILFAPYRAVGVGVASGAPIRGGDGATYVTDFGSYASSSRLPIPVPQPPLPGDPPAPPPDPSPAPGPGPLCQTASAGTAVRRATGADTIVLGASLFALTGC